MLGRVARSSPSRLLGLCSPRLLCTAAFPQTLSASLQSSVAKHPTWPAFGTRDPDLDAYQWMSYGDLADHVHRNAKALVASGVKPGDRVAIISANSWQWAAVAYATYHVGGVVVPMYEAQKASEWAYICEDSAPSLVFVSGPEVWAKLDAAGFDMGSVVQMTDASMQRFQATGRATDDVVPVCTPDSVANIIYTSGTTGNPKGVTLTHTNIMSNVNGLRELFGAAFKPGDRSLAFLPWAHVYGHTVELHFQLSLGLGIGLTHPTDLARNLKAVSPTVLACVPLVLYRFYDAIQAKLSAGSAVQKQAWALAMKAAHWRRDALNKGSTSPLPFIAFNIADALVFSKVREAFGGRLKLAIAGGAATSTQVQEFLSDIGIQCVEGYGATELSPIAATERLGPTECLQGGLRRFPKTQLLLLSPDNEKLPFDGEAQGELCVAGPQVMQGYHNQPEVTEKAFFVDHDGTKYFRTGDLAKIKIGDSCLDKLGGVSQTEVIQITGRAKETFKNEAGKFVSPAVVEDALKTSPLIEQAFVGGKDKPFTGALVVPHYDAFREYCNRHGIPFMVDATEPIVPLSNTALYDAMQAEMEAATAREPLVKAYEIPKAFVMLTEPFSVESGELTQKLSMKRAVIEERHKELLATLF